MHRILGAVLLVLAAWLSGCGGSADSETQGDNTTGGPNPVSSGNDVLTSPPTEGTSVYVTTKAFVESIQETTPTTEPETVPTAEEKALATDFNNELAFNLLRHKTGAGHSAFAVASRAQQMAMLAASADATSKAQIVTLLSGNDKGQLISPPPDVNLTKLLNTATTPQDGGYLSAFSTWGQYDFMFDETSLKALNTTFGSEVLAVDFVNDPHGSNLLLETWQSQITPFFTINPGATTKTRLAFASANRLNSDWPGNPAPMIQASFYYDIATVTQNYHNLQSNARITDNVTLSAGEIPLDKDNSLLMIMPRSTTCPATSAITANSLAFDRPFVFFIINNTTGIIAYTGIFNKPGYNACDELAMSGFLNNLSISSLNNIRSQLVVTQNPLYVPEFGFVSAESVFNTQPPSNSDTLALHFDHFNSQVTIASNSQGITASNSSATVVNLYAPSDTNGEKITGVYVGQNMSTTIGQEFGYQSFDNIDDAQALISKFGLTSGSASGPSGWPAVFGTTTADGTGF